MLPVRATRPSPASGTAKWSRRSHFPISRCRFLRFFRRGSSKGLLILRVLKRRSVTFSGMTLHHAFVIPIPPRAGEGSHKPTNGFVAATSPVFREICLLLLHDLTI